MEIVILIVVGLLLTKSGYSTNPRNFRFLVLSILGIFYFFIWKYLSFYFLIFNLSNQIQWFLILLLAGIISCFLWIAQKNQKNNLFAGGLLLCFCILTVASFLIDRQIKHAISHYGGFYEDSIKETEEGPSKHHDSHVFNHKAGGFRIKLPKSWEKVKHSSGQSYFKKFLGSQGSIEIRPGCFHESDLSLAEIVNNNILSAIDQNLKASKVCQSSSPIYECLTITRSEIENEETWRWFSVNQDNRQSVEVDIIFNAASIIDRKEARAILNSIELYKLSPPLPQCFSTVDWF